MSALLLYHEIIPHGQKCSTEIATASSLRSILNNGDTGSALTLVLSLIYCTMICL